MGDPPGNHLLQADEFKDIRLDQIGKLAHLRQGQTGQFFSLGNRPCNRLSGGLVGLR